MKDIICRADSIASAKVNDKSSQLTEDLQFVFTDYSLEIKHILKNTSPAQAQPASIITITTPGGAVKINNRIINVAVKSNKRLEIGKEYLLFLDYLPDSDSFKLNRAESVFDISDNRVEKFGIVQSPPQKNDKDIAAVTDLVNKIKTECSLEDGNEK
ncbi:MAG: hypothetical protein M3384_01025 [Acidobacteriota bacterium]|nr:hypothetical protein [Acidobacteriota bacterium]